MLKSLPTYITLVYSRRIRQKFPRCSQLPRCSKDGAVAQLVTPPGSYPGVHSSEERRQNQN